MVQPAAGSQPLVSRRSGQHLRETAPRPAPFSNPWVLAGAAAIVAIVVGLVAMTQSDATDVGATAVVPETTDAAPEPTPGVPVPATIADGPTPSTQQFDRGWVAVLAIVDRGEGRDALEAALAPIRGVIPSARVIETDAYPSLPPGDWAVVDGPFPTGVAAAEYCMSVGSIVGDDCSGRVLSAEQADRNLACSMLDGRLVGACER